MTTRTSLHVSLDRIPEGVVRLPFVETAENLELADWVRSADPIAVDCEFSRVGDEISIHGTVSGTLTASCDRCTREFSRDIHVPFLLYADRRGRMTPEEEEDLEREKQILFHDGRTLHFGDEVREEVILSLPIQTLCAEDCRGLCPKCGADLNRESCRCPEASTFPHADAP